jgi:hypothetical protein
MNTHAWCRSLSAVVFFALLAAPGGLRAQEFSVPEGYAFKSKEDFAKYEPQILKCIDYLETAPLGSEAGKRKPANAFFFTWVQGAPNVNVDMFAYVMGLTSKNKDFLLVYIAGWTRAELAHSGSADKIEYHLAGLRSIIKAYTQAPGAIQDDGVDEIARAEKDGKLLEWLKPRLQSK